MTAISGNIANFYAQKGLPLRISKANINPVQEPGTPTPQSPKAITGVSAVSVIHQSGILNTAEKFRGLYLGNCRYYTFDGSSDENWFLYEALGVHQFYINNSYAITSSAEIKTANNGGYEDIKISDRVNRFNTCYSAGGALCFNVQGYTVEQWKEYLSQNPISIIYEVDTPQTPPTQEQIETLWTDFDINGSTTLINLGGTYYGGYLTQDKSGRRQLVVTQGVANFSELSWSRSNNQGLWESYLFYVQITDKVNGGTLKCNSYKYDILSLQTMPDKNITRTSGSKYIYVRDDDYTTIDAFKTANANTIVVYDLAEPITIPLTDGEPIASLAGVNNVYASSGSVEVDVPNYFKCASIHATQNSNVVIDTASGSIANFETPLAMPLLDAQIDVNAVQDLHGQSGAYPPGGGVNKFDKDTMLINNAYINDIDGTQRTNTGDKCTDFIEIEPNTTYFIYTEQTTGRWGAWYDENKNYISGIELYGLKTSPANAKYVRFTVVRQGNGNPDTFSVNYPSTDTAYHPYSNICPINGWDEISVVRCRKNLYTYDANNITTGTTYTGATRSYLPLGLKGDCTLTFSASLKDGQEATVQFINIGKIINGVITPLQALIQASQIFTRTIHFNAGEEIVLVSASEQTYAITSSLPKYDIQIEVSSSESTYEPYNGSTTVIQLGNTYYGGRFIQDKSGKRQFEVTCAKEHFSLSGRSYTVANGYDSWSVTLANRSTVASSSANKKCSVCGAYLYEGSTAGVEHFYITPSGLMILYLTENTFRDGEFDVLYPLETPYTIDLPDGTPFKSLPGVNNIFADTGDITVKFRKIGE